MSMKIEAKKLIDEMQEIYNMSNYPNFTIDEDDNKKNDELWGKNRELFSAIYREFAKQAALITVDKIINEVYNISHQYIAIYDEETKTYTYEECKELLYWKEVKKEIENYKETVN